VDYPFESPATLSLCTGGGGLDRGVERAIGRLRTIAYVEIEAFIIENLLAGMEAGLLDSAPIWANLTTFPWEHFRGKVDLIMGGYPCQPFSTAGKRQGANDPRHLWPFIETGIDTIRPAVCFFENVAGHLTLGFEQVAASLQRMGYRVEAGLYTAAEVGAPHKRARLFILAILGDAESNYEWRQRLSEQGRHWVSAGRSSIKELADTYGDGPGANAGSAERSRSEDEGGTQRQERDEVQRERSGGDIGYGCAELGDSYGIRQPSERYDGEPVGSGYSGFIDNGTLCWPSRPGEPQYAWEEPRTLESRMGCTIDGYSFREDFLRALGNGVVEQTAELAFRDLLRKHFENY